jgi:hypothetical protein
MDSRSRALPKCRALDRRWKIERIASQACSTAPQSGEFFLLPDNKACGHRSVLEFTNSERKVGVHAGYPKLDVGSA